MRTVSTPRRQEAYRPTRRELADGVLCPPTRRAQARGHRGGDRRSCYKFVGLDGKVIGLSTFGRSAPGEAVFAHFGFTVEDIVRTLRAWLAEK
ncbi:MAG: transketolase-like TK C-terminal-containing protein [Gammaproteobacteria bacterium]